MAKALTTVGLALAATGLALSTPAAAAPVAHAQASTNAYAPGAVYDAPVAEHHRRWHRGGHGNRGYRGDYGRYDDRRYDDRPYYNRYPSNFGEPVRRDTRIWRGNDGRYYCRKDNGTTGLLIGAGVGALIGHEIAGRGGDRTLGAILGGAAGALLGRTIDRSSTRCG